jgi:phage recombination protein Bet
MAAAQQQSRPAAAAPPAQQPQQPAAQVHGRTVLDDIIDRTIEFTPFMAKDPIKLSARMVMRYLCKPTRSGKLCTEDDAVRFVMLCQARGLNPWEGDAFIVGYDSEKHGPEFNLITAHQAFLKRAEVHPHYDGMQSGVLVRRKWHEEVDGRRVERSVIEEVEGDFFDEGVLVGGWAKVYRKDLKYPMYRRLKLETFNKDRSRWKADPAGMIVKCAEADALRSSFPNSLGGMYLEGEMPEDERHRGPAESAEPPANGRHNLRAPRPAEDQPAAPEPSAEDARSAERHRETCDDLARRVDAAESARALHDVGATAHKARAEIGEAAYAAFERHYQQKYKALQQPAREPGDETDE